MDFAKGAAAAVGMILCGFTGCSESLGPPSLTSRDPLLKVPAIKLATEADDRSHEAQMIADLGSDDSAVRFYSIQGLSRLTGNTFGYHFYDDEARRQVAVMKWKAWLAAQHRANGRSTEAARLAGEKIDHTGSGWSTGG